MTIDGTKKHWYCYLLAAYFVVLPVNTGFTSAFGEISVSNYIALLFIGLGLISIFQNRIIRITKLDKPVVLYFLFSLVSILWSNGSSGTWFIATYCMNAALVLIGAALTYNEKEIRILEISILLGILFAIYAAYTNLGSISIYGRLMITFNRSIDPNQFACDLFPIIALSFCKFYREKNKRLIYLMVFVVSLIISLMTGSRGAILGIMGMSIAFLLINRTNMGKRLFYILLFILMIAFVAYISIDMLPNDLVERFAISNVLHSTGSGRFRIWSKAIETFKSSNLFHVFFGYGYGSFKDATKITNAYGTYYYAHNMFIQTLIEGGITGIVLLVYMLLCLFKMANKTESVFPKILLIGVIIASLDLDIQASRLFSVAILLPFVYKKLADISGIDC